MDPKGGANDVTFEPPAPVERPGYDPGCRGGRGKAAMIEFSNVGELRRPVLVAAFEGWNDAADAATAAVEHLEEVFHARTVGVIDPDDYYDFQVNRPSVSLSEGRTRRIE